MASLRKVCAMLTGEIAMLEAVIAGLPGGHQGYRAVRAMPGIGPAPGAVIVAEIGDITRFPCPAELCSWAGLTPATASPTSRSATGNHQAGIADLAGALIEAIQHVPACHPLRERKDDIVTRRGAQARNIAKVAWPASCLPGSSTPARRPGPIPGHRCTAARVSRPGRGRCVIAGFYWLPPSGGEAACLIDPAARTNPSHAPGSQPRAPPKG